MDVVDKVATGGLVATLFTEPDSASTRDPPQLQLTHLAKSVLYVLKIIPLHFKRLSIVQIPIHNLEHRIRKTHA